MLDARGHVVLSNFHCATLLSPSDGPDVCTGSECGTRENRAPEMILGWKYDFAVDCWGFGIVLSYLHFGRVRTIYWRCMSSLMPCSFQKHPFADGNELDALTDMQSKILHGQAPYHPSQTVPFAEWDLIKKVRK